MRRIEIVSVVAGGWSVAAIDLKRIPGIIIGVNDAAYHLPRCDIAVSMDRLWTEYRWPWLKEKRLGCWLRRSAVQNIPEVKDKNWAHVFECNNESNVFAEDPGRLNGTNSGACGFNLAYQMQPRKIVLFGFDMCRGSNQQAYWYPPYPWTHSAGATSTKKYHAWANQFEDAEAACKLAGIEVVNASMNSAIQTFQKTDIYEAKRA